MPYAASPWSSANASLGDKNVANSEAELRALFAAMHDVVLVIDQDGVYRKIAPTNTGLLYQPPNELLGKNLREVFPASRSRSPSRNSQAGIGHATAG